MWGYLATFSIPKTYERSLSHWVAGRCAEFRLGVVPQVQPVNTGTTGSDDPVVVVVVDGGTGPVNETTNVSSGSPMNPAATHQDVDTHAAEESRDGTPIEGGFSTIDQEFPSHA
jgi:hypothetical protein